MFLERLEIVGFRGINRPSLEHSNVLVGENVWGKPSLLDALTLLLAPHTELHCFTPDDFWSPPGQRQGSEHHLHIIFTFRESHVDQHLSLLYQPLSGVWVTISDRYARLFYRQEGGIYQQNRVVTLRSFIDEQGEALALADVDELGVPSHSASSGTAAARCALYAPYST